MLYWFWFLNPFSNKHDFPSKILVKKYINNLQINLKTIDFSESLNIISLSYVANKFKLFCQCK